MRAYLDGAKIDLKDGDEARTGDLELVRGTHTLLLHLVFDPEKDEAWSLGAT